MKRSWKLRDTGEKNNLEKTQRTESWNKTDTDKWLWRLRADGKGTQALKIDKGHKFLSLATSRNIKYLCRQIGWRKHLSHLPVSLL